MMVFGVRLAPPPPVRTCVHHRSTRERFSKCVMQMISAEWLLLLLRLLLTGSFRLSISSSSFSLNGGSPIVQLYFLYQTEVGRERSELNWTEQCRLSPSAWRKISPSKLFLWWWWRWWCSTRSVTMLSASFSLFLNQIRMDGVKVHRTQNIAKIPYIYLVNSNGNIFSPICYF